MEHPDKSLFDEVRGLRSEIEDSKERILKVEKDYQEKIENLENRMEVAKRCGKKIKKWQEQLDNRITFNVNEKEYQFLRSTLADNIYICNNQLLPENESYVCLEMNKKHFKAIIEIIRRGNNVQLSDKSSKRNFQTFLDKKIREDDNFISCIRHYFEKSLLDIVNDFGLKLIYLGKENEEKLFVSYSIDPPYDNSSINHYKANSVTELANKNSDKGFFLYHSTNLDITLSETIRTDKIYIKPFYKASHNWSSTNGALSTLIYGSVDGINFDYLATLPSNYGHNINDYLCYIHFTNIYSLRYLRFQTNFNSTFSISYLSFKDPNRKK